MNRKIISIITTLCLLCCTFSIPSLAFENNEKTGKSTVLIVTLCEASLLDSVNNSSGRYETVRDLILSDDGKNVSDRIISGQNSVISEIKIRIPQADFSDTRRFTAVTNAFTMKADIADIPAIKAVSGVKNVMVSHTESIIDSPAENDNDNGTSKKKPAPEEYDTIGMASKEEAGISTAYENGYTGKGTLIAVIDNEFDVRHDVFSAKPKGMKYNKDYVKHIAASGKLGISAKYNINDIFYNGKIIYAYDYGENDNKCYSGKTISHGTHVAGIAAGNNNGQGTYNFKGMAYDAQLALFKISDKDGTLKDEAIVAALDDAVKLGPDVINCSYGAVEYLTHDYEGKQLYTKLLESGTAVIAAAGNDAYNGYAIGIDEIPASYITYGTINSPSSLKGAFSVASSVPRNTYINTFFFVFNKSKTPVSAELIYSRLGFDDLYPELKHISAEGSEIPDSEEVDKVDYVYIKGTGTKKDLESTDVKDKIVILDEGELSVDTLIRNSAAKECYALIVIRKEKESRFEVTKNEESEFFVYSVDSSNKEYFLKHPTGTVSIRQTTGLVTQPESDPRSISEFSSVGTLADLTLKPEITAPGDNILSSVRNHDFAKMSGTSMSTPFVVGAYAIMKQFAGETGASELRSPYSTEEYIYKLLMSTAQPLEYTEGEGGNYYSPRMQGAGLIDLSSAITTKAYLSCNDSRPSVSLGESEDGRYSFDFTLTNFSDKEISFTPEIILQTDAYEKKTDKKTGSFTYINTLIPENINDRAVITVSSDGKPCDIITARPCSDVKITVSIELDTTYIRNHSVIFSNGFYTDGFVFLRAENEPVLSLPFSGFCGDWSKGRIFPDNMYLDENAKNTGFPDARSTLSIVSSFNSESYFSETAGKNIFGYTGLPYQISFGRNSLRSYLGIPDDVVSSPSVLLPSVYLMREAFDFTLSIFNENNELIFRTNFGDISCYFGVPDGPYSNFIEHSKLDKLQSYFDLMPTLSEGNYKLMLTASTVEPDGNAGRTESTAFTINVDNTAPQLDDYYLQRTDDGKLYLYVDAVDNHYIQGIRLSAVQHDNEGNLSSTMDMYDDILQYWGKNDNFVQYSYDPETRRFHFRYDLTRYKKFIKGKMEEKNEIYEDEDLTIIFENEKKYSDIEKDIIFLEAVDDAYNCSEGQQININSYGEAMLRFVDENGDPVQGVSIIAPDCTRASNEDGLLPLRNLPLGTNSYRIICDYTLADGSTYAAFDLTKQNYKTDKTFVVKKIEKNESSQESTDKKTPTVIVNFSTGSSNLSFEISLAVFTSSCLTLICLRRKKKNR